MVRDHFLLMKVDTECGEFLDQFPKADGYPHAYVLENDGTFLHSQGTAELEEGSGYNEAAVLAFLSAWKPVE